MKNLLFIILLCSCQEVITPILKEETNPVKFYSFRPFTVTINCDGLTHERNYHPNEYQFMRFDLPIDSVYYFIDGVKAGKFYNDSERIIEVK